MDGFFCAKRLICESRGFRASEGLYRKCQSAHYLARKGSSKLVFMPRAMVDVISKRVPQVFSREHLNHRQYLSKTWSYRENGSSVCDSSDEARRRVKLSNCYCFFVLFFFVFVFFVCFIRISLVQFKKDLVWKYFTINSNKRRHIIIN